MVQNINFDRCYAVSIYRRFEELWCLHLQGPAVQEDCSKTDVLTGKTLRNITAPFIFTAKQSNNTALEVTYQLLNSYAFMKVNQSKKYLWAT
jgi:hypothetical protein